MYVQVPVQVVVPEMEEQLQVGLFFTRYRD